MFEYFNLDKDEMIYSSSIFYGVVPIIIFIRIFVFYLFEFVTKIYSRKFSTTYNTVLSEKQKNDWTSKATSTFHAVLVTVLCIPHTITDIIYKESNRDLAFGITKRRVDVLLWTLAYLIYDLYMMIKINRQQLSKAMILHHVVCIGAFVLGIYLNVGTVFMASFIINELSTPFLHLRWYFSRMKLRDSMIGQINNLVFAITYLIVRGIWNTYVFYILCTGFYEYREELHNATVPFAIIAFLPLFALSHLLLNYYWLSLIILHIIKPKKSSNEDNTSSPSSSVDGSYYNNSNSSISSERKSSSTVLEGITVKSNVSNIDGTDISNLSSNSLNINKPKENTPLLKNKNKK